MSSKYDPTVGDALQSAGVRLQHAGILTARLDSLVLLEDILCRDRTHLLAHQELRLSHEQQQTFDGAISRRAKHEPLAYIRQRTEFYGRSFYVDQRVLEPRPESEALIDALRSLNIQPQQNRRRKIIDLGTGSGALAITAKLELPNYDVYGIDIDPASLDVASQNAKSLDADVTFLIGNLLEPLVTRELPMAESVLLCNLPYVPVEMTINKAAKYEPSLALFGGIDGLDVYRHLFKQINDLADQPAYILTESLLTQHRLLSTIAKQHSYILKATDGLVQTFNKA